MRIAVVVGARPQFVKAAPLYRALARHNAAHPDRAVTADLIHTGQHYDRRMCQVFFEEGELPEPLVDLGISGGSNAAMAGRMLEDLATLFADLRPDAVLVFGDTNSTLATALAAADLGLPTIHVEAGLRSGDLTMPEERNRIITDRLSSLLFCPSASSVDNLMAESIRGTILERNELPESGVRLRFGGPPLICDSGDIMLDALRHDLEGLPEDDSFTEEFAPDSYLVCTMHRAANVDDRATLTGLLDGLGLIAKKFPILLPVHPRLKARLEAFGTALPNGVIGIEPLGRNDFLKAVRDSAGVLTDSGGLQKEAAFLGKPCVVLRPSSEWGELVESGACVLAGTQGHTPDSIAAAWDTARTNTPGPTRAYGDGGTADHIVAVLDRIGFGQHV